MATIICVHGTNATGPEEGDRWWQSGGILDRQFLKMLVVDSAPLLFQPFVWDGHNSETSRRAGAARLLQVLEGLEQSATPYCVIGHSHGGSVAANALQLAALKQLALPNMARCITIGTPFISFARSRWLFSRSSLIERAALVAVSAYAFFFFCFLLQTEFSLPWTLMLVYVAILSTPPLAAYAVLSVINRRRFEIYRPEVLRFLRECYGDRMLSLRHPDDEAVSALRALRKMEVPFFESNFAVPAFSFAAIFVVPIALLFLAQSPSFMSFFAEPALGNPDIEASWVRNVANLVVNIILHIGQNLMHFLDYIGMRPENIMIAVSIGALGGSFLVTIVCMGVVFPFVAFAKVLSFALSKFLNPLTWSQVRKAAFGNDLLGEHSLGADHSARWTFTPSVELPSELAHEITLISNASAAEAIDKFRAGMTRILTSNKEDAREFFFSEYITWDQLIHTRYFDSARFCMLLAYIIADVPAFKSIVKLQDHPNRELIGHWYAEMRGAA